MEQSLFWAGYAGVRSYRIPALAYTKRGTLIAAADARLQEGCDNPNRIDKVIRRSFDRGKSWEEVMTVREMSGEGRNGSAAIDPCILYDERTERIWIIYCYSPAGIGLFNANMGTGYDGQGRKLLYDEADCVFYMEENLVYDSAGKWSGYAVGADGALTKDGSVCGNIRLSNGKFREFPTCCIQGIYSDDEGNSWSDMLDMTAQVKKPWMRFIGPGPGNGIVKKQSPAQGRYIVPVYYSNAYGLLSSAVIYSDDSGTSWRLGASPNDAGCPQTSRLSFDQSLSLQEMQVVELDDGRLRAFIRNTMPQKVIYYSDSMDGGETWTQPEASGFLDNPVCMLSAIRLPRGKDEVLFSGPWDKQRRVNGTVMRSKDGGLTLDSICTVTEAGFGYSSMAVLDENTIGLLYEVDNGTPVVEEMRFRTISLQTDFTAVTEKEQQKEGVLRFKAGDRV